MMRSMRSPAVWLTTRRCGCAKRGMPWDSPQSLTLLNNSLSMRHCARLTEVFGADCTLTSLEISANPIGGGGVEHLVKGLAHNTTLQTLSLNNCDLNLQGAQALSLLLL
eukprot:Sspe_Gene.92060::Locus_63790_Transcript_3_4_Confidence_0.625_Length_460::g.92060::m.92060